MDFLHVYSGFIASIGELHALNSFKSSKFGLSSGFSEFLDKIPVTILLDVLFRVFFNFSNVFLCPEIFIHKILKPRCHPGTETYGRLPWQFCNLHAKLQVNAEIPYKIKE